MRTSGFLIVLVVGGAMLLAGGCQDPGMARLNEGHAALDQGRYDEAMAAADQYLREHPAGGGAASAFYLRGNVIQQRVKSSDAEATADFRLAEQHYLKALQLAPDRKLEGRIRIAFGNTAYWQNDYAAALTQWSAAMDLLESEEWKIAVLYRLGICRQRLGQWNEADAAFASVQQQSPGSDVAERARRHQGARAFYVQVAAFAAAASADKLVATLRSRGIACGRVEKPERHVQVVMAGPVQTYAQALGLKGKLGAEYRDALIVP